MSVRENLQAVLLCYFMKCHLCLFVITCMSSVAVCAAAVVTAAALEVRVRSDPLSDVSTIHWNAVWNPRFVTATVAAAKEQLQHHHL